MKFKEIVIGQKLNRREFLKGCISVILYSLMGALLFLSITNIMDVSTSFKIGIHIVFFIIQLLCMYLPLVGSEKCIIIDTRTINYYSPKGYRGSFQRILEIMQNKEASANISIPIKNIKRVYITYFISAGMYAQTGYAPKLNVCLSDDTLVSFPAESISSMNQQYADALNLLGENGIEIIDNYHMREHLGKASFHKYMEEVTKHGKL